jgi:uncharacterized membrane protein YfcA
MSDPSFGETVSRLVGVAVAAAAGGMINSIAGGGTLLTFPSLVALGVPPLVANATSTVALWPGALSSMFGYRARIRGAGRWAAIFAVPSLLGGGVGAMLLLSTPADRFDAIVPWLVLGATALFALQGPVTAGSKQRRARCNVEAAEGRHPSSCGSVTDGPLDSSADRLGVHSGAGAPPPRTGEDANGSPFVPSHSLLALGCQFCVGVYGGYFGAGIGILMLAVLGFMGFSDIHQMNGLKNWGGLCINLVASLLFVVSDIVDWPVALAMAVGAILGGYLASRLAQRVPQRLVRRMILVIGLGSGLWLLR